MSICYEPTIIVRRSVYEVKDAARNTYSESASHHTWDKEGACNEEDDVLHDIDFREDVSKFWSFNVEPSGFYRGLDEQVRG